MLTCALPDFDSDDLVSFQNPVKFWTLFSIYVIAALLLLCSLVFKLQTLMKVTHGTHVSVNWLKLDPLIIIFGHFSNYKEEIKDMGDSTLLR